jgi:hypothetical protein
MKTFVIGDTAVDIPDFLDTRDDDGTLVAYPPATDFANLRLSILSIKKDGVPCTGAGEDMIRRRAQEDRAHLWQQNGKVWYQSVEPSSEGSDGSQMHYSFVGLDAYALVVSCFVDAEETANPITKQVLDSVLPIIESFRKKSE